MENEYIKMLEKQKEDLIEALEQLLTRIVVSDTWDKKAVLVAKNALEKAKKSLPANPTK